MALKIRAEYRDGQIKLLDPVDLEEGQQLTISVEAVTDREKLKAILGDMVIWSDPSDDSDAWVEDMAEEIDNAFQGDPPLSQYIIEDRGEF
ncbi:MAG: antitoxin family protein [Chloroflexota bacterium]